MHSPPPPAREFSRFKLKKLAVWIRDDLDILVAREGPDIFRSDDVLVLHETLIALQHAYNITAMDLRATGIHRAVQDIAGMATRWPSRLCDDCDTIETIWTERFGPLRDLRPFLFGRGGRLEGIASPSDYSREALLKRWAATCPHKIDPRRSHSLGNLSFRAGAWWINPFFAHHAGMIGLESTEGGTTFDKHGAYALLLKDTGDVEADSLEHFTYRCGQNDKGKFRLTSAIPRSRGPVRVLRSHGINSIWGPKAGVRYEGLYVYHPIYAENAKAKRFIVKGWSIQTAKSTDAIGGEWKEGDIIFEVKFERSDPTPMMEVIKHPTAAELDDYSEYKRLRKAHRDGKRKGQVAPFKKYDAQPTVKAPTPILPQQPIATQDAAPKGYWGRTLSSSHKTLFTRPQFDQRLQIPVIPALDKVSPTNVSDVDQFGLAIRKSSKPAMPRQLKQLPLRNANDSVSNNPSKLESATTSITASGHMTGSTQSAIKEVAPWIDFDPGLNLPSPDNQIKVTSKTIISQAPLVTKEKFDSSLRAEQPSAHKGAQQRPILLSPGKREYRKSILVRHRNPMAKHLDGTREQKTRKPVNDYFDHVLPSEEAHQSFSSPASHEKVPPNSPISPLDMDRRNAICAPNLGADLFPRIPIAKNDLMSTQIVPNKDEHDPFADSAPFPAFAVSLPMSLKQYVSKPVAASRARSSTSPIASTRFYHTESSGSPPPVPNPDLKKKNTIHNAKGYDVKVTFRDPFCDLPQSTERVERDESSVAPNVVL